MSQFKPVDQMALDNHGSYFKPIAQATEIRDKVQSNPPYTDINEHPSWDYSKQGFITYKQMSNSQPVAGIPGHKEYKVSERIHTQDKGMIQKDNMSHNDLNHQNSSEQERMTVFPNKTYTHMVPHGKEAEEMYFKRMTADLVKPAGDQAYESKMYQYNPNKYNQMQDNPQWNNLSRHNPQKHNLQQQNHHQISSKRDNLPHSEIMYYALPYTLRHIQNDTDPLYHGPAGKTGDPATRNKSPTFSDSNSQGITQTMNQMITHDPYQNVASTQLDSTLNEVKPAIETDLTKKSGVTKEIKDHPTGNANSINPQLRPNGMNLQLSGNGLPLKSNSNGIKPESGVNEIKPQPGSNAIKPQPCANGLKPTTANAIDGKMMISKRKSQMDISTIKYAHISNECVRLTDLLQDMDGETLKQTLLKCLYDGDRKCVIALGVLFPRHASVPPQHGHCVRCHRKFKLNEETHCIIRHPTSKVEIRTQDKEGTNFRCKACGADFRLHKMAFYDETINSYMAGFCFNGKHTVNPMEVRYSSNSAIATCEENGCIQSIV
ncbi:unnamed protein product [Owenia fusiformis]|uniref:Uncharacterized protein n=1 Tax=Owenia fusiformis TaxID=6347 RepID=A0A8S4MUK3_OWEFU|nr:unnamed protein product [Owenia fusiformis]